MGTSGSSDGPGVGVPFDPPWLDDIETAQPSEDQPPGDQDPYDGNSGDGQQKPPPEPTSEPPVKLGDVAPSRRFANARRALGEFARTGSEQSFKRAVGHYSHTGMGGARTAANRLRTSTRAAANVFNTLQSAREKTDPAINEWVDSLTSRNASAQEIADEIVKHVAPSGGSQDEAACQQSMAQAMANTPSMTSIQRKSYVQGVVGEYLRRGGTENIERAERFMDSMEKNHSR